MSKMILKKAGEHYGQNLFTRNLEQYTPADPLFEYYTNESGKKKKRKRIPPHGLSKRDQLILRAIQTRAHHLDKSMHIFGFRFGPTFLLALLFPILGPSVDLLLSYSLIIRKARQADLPAWLISRMVMNNMVGIGVGFLPIVGDIVLAIYKANSRNAMLLEEFLRVRGEEFVRMRGVEDVNGKERGAEEDGEGWFKSLMRRAKRSGVSPKDAEQVKPGAGMTSDEMKQTGSTSSATGLSTTQKVTANNTTDASPPKHSITKGKFVKMPTINSAHEHESESTSSASSLKQKHRSRSGKFNLFGPSNKETEENRAEVGRPKGSSFVEHVD